MIPSIETIIEDLLAGRITKQQAIGWLHQHAEGAVNESRDLFAAMAMQGLINEVNATATDYIRGQAQLAYKYADAMLDARSGDQDEV